MNQRVMITSRERLEAKIEELIGLLDLLDGDTDIEANGDELDVGMPESWCRSRSYSETVLEDDEDGVDAEAEEAEEDGDEHESSLSEDDNIGGEWFLVGMI